MSGKCVTKRFSLYKFFGRLYSRRAELDMKYFCEPTNSVEVAENVQRRKGIGDVEAVLATHRALQLSPEDASLQERLYKELLMLPNKTHPHVKDYGEEPRRIKFINQKRDFGNHKPLDFSDITRRLNLMRTDQIGHVCGPKSYYLLGELAQLEQALIAYTVRELLRRGSQLVSVPDIVPAHGLRGCGLNIDTDRNQVYTLDPELYGPDLFLSGTAEISIGCLLQGRTFKAHELPYKLAAVSRCFRAESSNALEQRGLYRVHQFTKVEMFVVATPEQSEEMLELILKTEEDLFTPLEIHMQVLDMPPKELGAPAYRKYDIEAWMPGRGSYGEISSCSNCTDYQSRRLHIKYEDESGRTHFAHTLNGTACAVPRMLIALLETHQQPNGTIIIPEVLRPFMSGKDFISKKKHVPELKLLKIKPK